MGDTLVLVLFPLRRKTVIAHNNAQNNWSHLAACPLPGQRKAGSEKPEV